MTSFLLRADEGVLAEGECMDMKGPVGFPGYAVLTNQRVCFEPTAFNQAMGVTAWTVEMDAVREASLRKGVLVLECGDRQRRLGGAGARIIHDRLAPLFAAQPQPTYADDERVLLFSPAELEANELLSVSGELIVTTRQLRFQPRRMERLIWPELEVNLGIDKVTGIQVTGVRRRLEVLAEGRTLRFHGAVLAELYAALQAATELRDGAVTAAEIENETWPASLHRGPLAHSGEMVRTGTQLAFLVAGMLNSMTGVRESLTFPVDDVDRLLLRGVLGKRIEVHSGGVQAVLSCADIVTRYDELVRWRARRAGGPVWLGGCPAGGGVRARIDEALAPWREHHRLPAAPVLFAPAVRVFERTGAVPGWLLLGDETLVWLPGRTPQPGDTPVRIPVGGWLWRPNDGPPDEVRLHVGGAPYRWLPAPGAAFHRALAAHADEVERRLQASRSAARLELLREANTNRRDTYRVRLPADEPSGLEIWILKDNQLERLECDLLDFSLCGCALRTNERLSAEALLRVDLPSGDMIQPVQAEVVHDRPLPGAGGWMTGLRFLDLWGHSQVVVRATWMRFQQDEARRARLVARVTTRDAEAAEAAGKDGDGKGGAGKDGDGKDGDGKGGDGKGGDGNDDAGKGS